MAPPVRYCIPGERLCNLEEGSPGSGTYTRHGYIFSSLAGCLMKTSENGAVPVVSVMRETESQLLPDVGAVVTCKVSSINSRFAKVHILYVGSTPLKNAFRGTIRKEDIRATEKDKVFRWFPSAGVRCSAPRPTLKNSEKWPEYSPSSYRPKPTYPKEDFSTSATSKSTHIKKPSRCNGLY
ncbi:exosome complex component CSL4 isoform 3 [Mus musculus]|uniref:exosome complex component CSL4 isoform 3 n=1 Tax=Mus musculus TaxID=10090 RepID=UPI00001EC599|nr:exosome complex component CSL4 isoform 3 [Mus musculus]|eukprot:NP_001307160.1 exosome complex component CSL4 isoform 3 [Mus musculus]